MLWIGASAMKNYLSAFGILCINRCLDLRTRMGENISSEILLQLSFGEATVQGRSISSTLCQGSRGALSMPRRYNKHDVTIRWRTTGLGFAIDFNRLKGVIGVSPSALKLAT
jgi:hypothetical protein